MFLKGFFCSFLAENLNMLMEKCDAFVNIDRDDDVAC